MVLSLSWTLLCFLISPLASESTKLPKVAVDDDVSKLSCLLSSFSLLLASFSSFLLSLLISSSFLFNSLFKATRSKSLAVSSLSSADVSPSSDFTTPFLLSSTCCNIFSYFPSILDSFASTSSIWSGNGTVAGHKLVAPFEEVDLKLENESRSRERREI